MSTYRVIVTGSRKVTPEQRAYVEKVLTTELKPCNGGPQITIVHGAAPGVDTVADRWAQRTIYTTSEPHVADWCTHGYYAGPTRNAEMVATGADLCIAFPDRRSHRGTSDCIGRAIGAGIPVRVFPLPLPEATP